MSDPIAYLITFRTYGTWLHGDERGSMDRDHNAYGTPLLDSHAGRQRSARQRLVQPPVSLTKSARDIVTATIAQVCDHRDWTLHASNARSTHIHVVVSAPQAPEQVMLTFKSWSTRRLRESGMVEKNAKVWSRHGSTKYLWKPSQLVEACQYVLETQDDHGGPVRTT